MTANQKRDRLRELWSRCVEQNPTAPPEWRTHPNSFISWGMSKLRDPKQVLSSKRYSTCTLCQPYNLCFKRMDEPGYIQFRRAPGYVPPNPIPSGTRLLNEQQVRDIRTKAENGEARGAIAEEYGITRRMVNLIVARKRWKWVK